MQNLCSNPKTRVCPNKRCVNSQRRRAKLNSDVKYKLNLDQKYRLNFHVYFLYENIFFYLLEMESNEIKISYFKHPIYKDYVADENGKLPSDLLLVKLRSNMRFRRIFLDILEPEY